MHARRASSIAREQFLENKVALYAGDCMAVLCRMDAASVHSVVTDPPYHLTSIVKRFGAANAAPAKAGKTGAYKRASAGFMGKVWDGGDIAFQIELWAQVLRVLKPGGHLIAFSGTRTYHRMACAIEDAGFEIRDQIGWCFGSGFPKSHDVSKGIDKAAGAQRILTRQGTVERSGYGDARFDNAATDSAREWQGWGTALKPAWEPICLARKPLEGTVAANVLKWGTGAINIEGCRVDASVNDPNIRTFAAQNVASRSFGETEDRRNARAHGTPSGRWPANILHDGSDEVVAAFPETGGGGAPTTGTGNRDSEYDYGTFADRSLTNPDRVDSGSAARFFYTAKADADDRLGSKHPTVKPLDLMQWLVRLVTPKGGLVLDPFAGTGTTGEAAFREGCRAVLIEREAEYQNDTRRRMHLVLGGPEERRRESIKAKALPIDHGPLFDGRTT